MRCKAGAARGSQEAGPEEGQRVPSGGPRPVAPSRRGCGRDRRFPPRSTRPGRAASSRRGRDVAAAAPFGRHRQAAPRRRQREGGGWPRWAGPGAAGRHGAWEGAGRSPVSATEPWWGPGRPAAALSAAGAAPGPFEWDPKFGWVGRLWDARCGRAVQRN